MRHKKCDWDTWEVTLTPKQFCVWQTKHMLWTNVLRTEKDDLEMVVMYARRWYFIHHNRKRDMFYIRRARYAEWFKWAEICMRPGVDVNKIYFNSDIKSGIKVEARVSA